jgi:putative nucleotidyltransferase with HDIG domain
MAYFGQKDSMNQMSDDESASVELLLQQARDCLENEPQQALKLIQSFQLMNLNQFYQAHAFWVHAKCLIRIGDLEEAKLLLAKSIQLFARFQDPNEIKCRIDLARLYRDLSDFPSALELLNDTLFKVSHESEDAVKASILNMIATVYMTLREPAEAFSRLEQVLSLQQALGDARGEAMALINIGSVQNDFGSYDKSLECLIHAHQIITTLKDANLETTCLINIGVTHLFMEQPDQAIAFFKQAGELGRSQRHHFNEILSLIRLGEAHNALKEHQVAKNLLQTTLFKARDNQRYLETSILALLGTTHLALSEIKEAKDYFGLALIQAEATNDREAHFDALIGLGQTSLVLNQTSQAIEYLEQALGLAVRTEQKRSASNAHQHLSVAFEAAEQPGTALEHFRQHHRLEREILNEDTARKTKNMTMQLDLERSRHEAETYRLRTQVFEEANMMLEQKVFERTQELEEARVEVVMRLAVAAEYRDDHTGQHTFRVGHTSAMIARALGVPDEEVETLRMAARLHDIGKIGIPDLIMLKPAKLSFDEFERIKTHTTIGAQILSGGKTPLLKMAETIALTHHERWDGKGYPRGLAGEDIALLGRIVSVADVFDALTSERPYKRAWTAAQARAEIESKSGTQFDANVVRVFSQLLDQGVRFDAL